MVSTADLTTSLASRFSVVRPELLQRQAALEDLDKETILAARMGRLVQLWQYYGPPDGVVYDVAGLEFDPLKINQEVSTYHELLVRNRVNQGIRAVTLAFATGTDLDALASNYPGGMPRVEGEDYTLQGDDRYRRRIWLSPNILSPHGTPEAYIYYAVSSDDDYRDAGALTKQGTGHIFIPVLNESPVLGADGHALSGWVKALGSNDYRWTWTIDQDPIPSNDRLLATLKYIQDKGRKALTDWVSVVGPKITRIDYAIDFWTYPGTDLLSVVEDIQAALEKQIEARRWLGSDHVRMDILAAVATLRSPRVFSSQHLAA